MLSTLRRALTTLVCALLLTGTIAAPAAADHISFSTHGSLTCPRPWLLVNNVPRSLCTLYTPHVGPFFQAGFYFPKTESYAAQTPRMWGSTGRVDRPKTKATDGMVGTFRGAHVLHSAYGDVTYGIQYTYYGFQAIGRWGNFNHHTGLFYPNSDWYWADHAI